MKIICRYAVLAVLLNLALILDSCAPSIPHTLEGRAGCITCHGQNAVKPFPNWHQKDGFGNDACAGCHDQKR